MQKRKGHFFTALRLLWRTRGFLIPRVALYGVYFFATVGFVWTLVGVFTFAADTVAAAVGLYAIGRRYLRRQRTAGQVPHLLAMVQALDDPKGSPRRAALVESSEDLVDTQFPEYRRLIRLEDLVQRVLRDTSADLALEIRPFPGFAKLGALRRALLGTTTAYLRSAVLSEVLRSRDPNVWAAARDTLVRYAQVAPRMATSALRLQILGGLFLLAVGGLILLPTWRVVNLTALTGGASLAALAWGVLRQAQVVKQALFEPFAMGYVVPAFRRAIEGVRVEPDWTVRLEERSKRFRQLQLRAEAFVPAPAHGADPPVDDDADSELAPASAQPQPPVERPADGET
jgi:hypothetical protein